MKLRDAMKALERAEEKEKQAEAKTRVAKAALKRAKKETAFAARAAIARALVSGVEEGWVTVDLDRLGACARELMSEGDADAVEQITEVLREIESAREKAIAQLTTEPEDEEDDELARILAGETSEEPTDPVEIALATEKPPPRRPLGFRRPVVPHKP
jgi:hypothetical protein